MSVCINFFIENSHLNVQYQCELAVGAAIGPSHTQKLAESLQEDGSITYSECLCYNYNCIVLSRNIISKWIQFFSPNHVWRSRFRNVTFSIYSFVLRVLLRVIGKWTDKQFVCYYSMMNSRFHLLDHVQSQDLKICLARALKKMWQQSSWKSVSDN